MRLCQNVDFDTALTVCKNRQYTRRLDLGRKDCKTLNLLPSLFVPVIFFVVKHLLTISGFIEVI
ncbi:MAG: hypothetical protein IKC85_06275 [Bacteroidaceae bacterium]|nr:hypothetical protein [Bacteroidaceae bacterium]